LEGEDLRPEEIETVIYTHLHNDHAAHCSLFKNARIIFQKDELENLLDPLPVQLWRKDYDPELVPELRSMKPLMVDGDIELTDGIKLYKTPGHTLGSQSVAVNTKKGTVVLIGDLCGRYFLTFPDHGEIVDMKGERHELPKAPPYLGPALGSSLIYDYYAFYTSIYKVKSVASRNAPGFVITGHEPSLLLTGI
jgi:glyoxylase-like metal-dependent hydrolase (beta-lactamase superfamily II)